MTTNPILPLCHTRPMTPTREEGLLQLERILASELFQNAGRLSRFLRFVTERALAGEGERLKEYVVGVEVFDRDQQYDPRLDSIVRVEAGRLRTRLDQYYQGPGRDDALRIQLPKGSYVPSFELREPEVVERGGVPVPDTAAALPSDAPPLPALHRRFARLAAIPLLALGLTAFVLLLVWSEDAGSPRVTAGTRMQIDANAVAVLPFESANGNADEARLATGLTAAVTAALVRQGRWAVVPSRNVQALSTRGTAQQMSATLGAAWLLEARVMQSGAQVIVEARLTNSARNRKLWVDSFSAADPDALALQVADGAGAVLAAQGNPPR